jgi:hypothetical protein
MWERGERKQVLDGRRGETTCKICYEEREKIEHMWNGCSEMRERERERERKEPREIQNEDDREIRWMKKI